MKRIQPHLVWITGVVIVLVAGIIRPWVGPQFPSPEERAVEASQFLSAFRLAVLGSVIFVIGIALARERMSVGVRYCLLALGCILHASLVSLSLLHFDGVAVDSTRPLQVAGFWLALFVWPAWTFVLWRFGWRRKIAVAVPVIIGLFALQPVFMSILFLLALMGGAHP